MAWVGENNTVCFFRKGNENSYAAFELYRVSAFAHPVDFNPVDSGAALFYL